MPSSAARGVYVIAGAVSAAVLALMVERKAEAESEGYETMPGQVPFGYETTPGTVPYSPLPVIPGPGPAPALPWESEGPMPNTLPGEPHTWDNQIIYACGLYGMDDPRAPYFLKAMISAAENPSWNPRARGDSLVCRDQPGAPCCSAYRGDAYFTGWASIGLGQINRCAHPDLAARFDLRDPNQNILAAAEVMTGAYQDFYPEWERIRAAYQGGAGAGRAWPNVQPVITRTVQSVMTLFRGWLAQAALPDPERWYA